MAYPNAEEGDTLRCNIQVDTRWSSALHDR